MSTVSADWPAPADDSARPGWVAAGPAAVLDLACEATAGKDVRLGGGATTVGEFLAVDLVDTLYVAVSPIELGAGSRLWESPDELLDRFHLEVVPSPSGVTHHLFWGRRHGGALIVHKRYYA